MCTVSIITLDATEFPQGRGAGGLRMVCNRDESRQRPPAAPPKWRGNGACRAIWPMDLEAGGTWIGASERGLALCLLNLNLDPPVIVRGSLFSRGLVIPRLLESPSLEDVANSLARMSLARFAPFRLIGALAGPQAAVLEARWDRTRLSISWHSGIPLCFVSSGLGDALVAPRLDLFEQLVVGPGSNPRSQDEFHRHTWPDRPELSVLMSRHAARTVSIATLEIRPQPVGVLVEMAYQPVPDSLRTAPAIPARARVVRA